MSGIAWQRTPDRRTWCAATGDLVLTVSRLTNWQWAATVAGAFTDARSPEFGTRLAAQRWAERRAEVAGE